MSSEQRVKRSGYRWAVLAVVALVTVAIWIGVEFVPRDMDSQEAGSRSAQTGSDGASDSGGHPTAEEAPTDPPRVIGIDPQAPRTTTSPALAPAPTDGAGAEFEPVPPDAVVEVPSDAEISLTRIEAVDGEAIAGGEISGPAIRVTVSIENTGTTPVDLEYVVVNAYSGADRMPAGTIMQPGGAPFAGSLDPGDRAEGVYLFSVATTDRGDVTITVDHGVGEPIVVFRGDLT